MGWFTVCNQDKKVLPKTANEQKQCKAVNQNSTKLYSVRTPVN